jgi:YHS domain-containing protein
MGTILYLLFWAALFFVMMRFGCGAHVMGHHHHPSGDAHDGDGRWSGPAEAHDPVCGKTVSTAVAKSSIWSGRAYYFCSQACRDKFEAAPQSYQGAVPIADQGVA